MTLLRVIGWADPLQSQCIDVSRRTNRSCFEARRAMCGTQCVGRHFGPRSAAAQWAGVPANISHQLSHGFTTNVLLRLARDNCRLLIRQPGRAENQQWYNSSASHNTQKRKPTGSRLQGGLRFSKSAVDRSILIECTHTEASHRLY